MTYPASIINMQTNQYIFYYFSTASVSKKEDERKCDLCGSSTAQFQCDLCTKQKFCISCDQMYHRHPKRQMHVRKVRMIIKIFLKV